MNLEQIVKEIKQNNSKHPSLIGIEGYGGSAKSTVARRLAGMLGDSYVIGIDDFIVKDHIVENDWDKQAFDRKRLENEVLRPFKANGDVNYHKLEWVTNTLSASIHVPCVKYLIIEGISCYHPSISHYYDLKMWIDVPISVAKARGKLRDKGNENEVNWNLWAKNDLLYQQKYHPELEADFIIKN